MHHTHFIPWRLMEVRDLIKGGELKYAEGEFLDFIRSQGEDPED